MTTIQKIYHTRFVNLFGTTENADRLINWLCERNFFNQPASTRFHNNYPSGLAEHVLNVTEVLEHLIHVTAPNLKTTYGSFNLTEKISDNIFRPFIVALGHDITKSTRYFINKKRALVNGTWTDVVGYEYKKFDAPFPDNINCVLLLSEIIQLSELEKVAIYWAEGAFQLLENKNMLKGFNSAMSSDVRVYLTSVADMLCSQYIEKTLTEIELNEKLKAGV